MIYTQHPIGRIMPRMEAGEYQTFAANIVNTGLQNPIILYQNQVLDGWHRYNVCVSQSIEPRFEPYSGTSPASYVMSQNLERRHLEAGQRAMIGAEIEPVIEAEKKRNRAYVSKDTYTIEGTIPSAKRSPQSRIIAAKMAGSNEKDVQLAKKLKRELPEIADKVKAGEMTLKQGRNELYKKKEAEKKCTVDVEIKNSDIQLHNCDIADSLVKNDSIDVIITDPPYPRGFLSCWSKLARFAAEKLKPGGVLLAMSGQSYLPEVYANMKCEGLNYYWTACIKNTVSCDLWTIRTKTQWKPLLWYVKGDYTRTYQGTDVFVPQYKDTVEGQDYHKWGQSLPLFEELVEKFSYAGETICDPFMGGGTGALACINKKRKFVGIEIDKEVFAATKARIAGAQV